MTRQKLRGRPCTRAGGEGRERGDQQFADEKLRVLVSLDSDLASARVDVRGTVTSGNLAALYVIVRRTNYFLPGMEITLDLSAAKAADPVLETLDAAAAQGLLPPESDPAGMPCRLRVLQPLRS